MKKKILFLGGTGYLGSHILYELKDKKYDIVYTGNKNKLEFQNNFTYKKIDLSSKSLKNLLKKFNPDVIIHAASLNLGLSEKKKLKGLKECINPLIDIESYLKFINKKIKIIYFSTFQVYQYQKLINENSMINLSKRYAYNHFETEKRLLKLKEKFKLDLTILRISNCYGIFLKPKKQFFEPLINKLVLDTLKTRKVVIHSDGKVEKDYIYINDLIKFVKVNLLQKNKKYPTIINLGTNISTSLLNISRVIYKIINKKLKLKVKILVMNLEKRYSKVSYKENIRFNSKYLKEKKNIKVEKGIEKLITFLEQNNYY